MEKFIYDYFIEPIWSRTGYNIINTLVYAAIALGSIYLIHKILKGKIPFDIKFVQSILPFVLLGSTLRSITDAVDGGEFLPISQFHEFILQIGIFNYGYLTVSPGIYIVTAVILFSIMSILYWKKRMDLLPVVGIALWIPAFLLIVPFFDYAVHAIPIIFFAAIPTALAMYHFKDKIYSLVVAGQSLDGAATFYSIDIFSKLTGIEYFEQHVFSAAIGNFAESYFFFFALKAIVGFAAVYIIKNEKMDQEDKYFLALLLIIMGFAPGIRDILRMIMGT